MSNNVTEFEPKACNYNILFQLLKILGPKLQITRVTYHKKWAPVLGEKYLVYLLTIFHLQQ